MTEMASAKEKTRDRAGRGQIAEFLHAEKICYLDCGIGYGLILPSLYVGCVSSNSSKVYFLRKLTQTFLQITF